MKNAYLEISPLFSYINKLVLMALWHTFDYIKVVGKTIWDIMKLAYRSDAFLPGCHTAICECKEIIFDVKILGPLLVQTDFDDPLFHIAFQCNSY